MSEDNKTQVENTANPNPAETAQQTPNVRKKRILLIVIILLVLIIGGAAGFFVMKGKGEDHSASKTEEPAAAHGAEEKPKEEAASHEEKPSESEHGEKKEEHKSEGEHGDKNAEGEQKPSGGPAYIELNNVIVNLNSPTNQPSFLKLSLSLLVNKSEDQAKINAEMPKVNDVLQSYLRQLRAEDLRGSEGLFMLREELLLRLNKELYPAAINDIFFNQVIVQ
jgi:flagellar FliL protein